MKVRLHGSIVQWDCPECKRSNTQTLLNLQNMLSSARLECAGISYEQCKKKFLVADIRASAEAEARAKAAGL